LDSQNRLMNQFCVGCRPHQAERSIELIYRTVGFDAPVRFRDAAAVHQGRLPCISGFSRDRHAKSVTHPSREGSRPRDPLFPEASTSDSRARK
jgi:hypothetical protein